MACSPNWKVSRPSRRHSIPRRSARFGTHVPGIQMLQVGLQLEQAPPISVAQPGGLCR